MDSPGLPHGRTPNSLSVGTRQDVRAAAPPIPAGSTETAIRRFTIHTAARTPHGRSVVKPGSKRQPRSPLRPSTIRRRSARPLTRSPTICARRMSAPVSLRRRSPTIARFCSARSGRTMKTSPAIRTFAANGDAATWRLRGAVTRASPRVPRSGRSPTINVAPYTAGDNEPDGDDHSYIGWMRHRLSWLRSGSQRACGEMVYGVTA